VIDRVWRDTEADGIEPALAAIWRDIGRRAAVARAVMSNLVLVRACEASEPLDAFAASHATTLDEIVSRHPSRVIVIAHERGCSLTREPIAARVGVATYGPPHARYAVEHVSVRSSCDESSLPSIVRRLTRGDLPTSIWCPDDLSKEPPMRAIVAEARQLIYDSRSASHLGDLVRGIDRAVQGFRIDLADLNWRRLAPVRSALRRTATDLPLDALRRGGVRITHAPDESALASLLAAWLSARLSWSPATAPRIEEADRDVLVAVSLPGSARPMVELTTDEVRVSGTARTVETPVAPESLADAVVAELRSLSIDPALRDTLRALARTIT
jgi:glucose-6-phosphate dehydrogenase assembly protein OpcA